MRVQLVDPPAYSPPYDHSLASALAAAGADVELLTSRYLYGPLPPVDGFRLRDDAFYRGATASRLPTPLRRAARVAEHLPGMLRARREAGAADVVHYQWLTLEGLDARLLPRGRATIFTSHNVVRRGQGTLRERAVRSVLNAVDAVVVHTEVGRSALLERYKADPARVHVIPHGAFDYLTRLSAEEPLAAELAAVEGPVVLFFGLLRPYKGVDVLIEAFQELERAELWIVGRPWMDIEPLREAAAQASAKVRFIDRFVSDAELPAFFRRADVVVLPYRSIDQSGVLYTALAFGRPLVLSDVGGFSEIGRNHGAARLVPPGDAPALRDALSELLGDRALRNSLASRASAAAHGTYSWEAVARRTLALYDEVLSR